MKNVVLNMLVNSHWQAIQLGASVFSGFFPALDTPVLNLHHPEIVMHLLQDGRSEIPI